jgi:hypothetical protein
MSRLAVEYQIQYDNILKIAKEKEGTDGGLNALENNEMGDILSYTLLAAGADIAAETEGGDRDSPDLKVLLDFYRTLRRAKNLEIKP